MVRRLIGWLIAGGLLIYGLLRLGIGIGLVGQDLGLLSIAALEEPIADIATFLDEKREAQIVPFTVAGYAAYIALMGLVLGSGALGFLMRRRPGLPLIGGFLGLWVLLFVNFQTINAKLVHLAVCFVLFLILLAIRRREEA